MNGEEIYETILSARRAGINTCINAINAALLDYQNAMRSPSRRKTEVWQGGMTLHERGPWEDRLLELVKEWDEDNAAGATAMLWILGVLALGLTAATVAAWWWL